MPSVSAALIVKNEAHFLPGCLESLHGRVDDIVVVDTGSSDSTVEIAKGHGARVFEFPWRNDFAAARNAGLDQAKSDWILYIDADERLSLPGGAVLGSRLDHAHWVGARLKFRPTVRGTPCLEYRLFRNRPDIRFVGAIHETVTPALEALTRGGALMVGDIDAELVHLGYEGDLTHKYQRNLPMLRRMVGEWPERLYYWLDLGKALAALGEIEEARKVCQEGLKLAARQTTATSRSIAALIASCLADIMLDAGEDASAVIADGLAFHPGLPVLLYQQARASLKSGNDDMASSLADQLLATGKAGYSDPLISVDERLFGARALEIKSLVNIRLGRRKEAAALMQQASALEPEDRALRIKAAALAGQSYSE